MNIDNAKLQAKATNKAVTWHSSWGDCEGENTVTYLGEGYLHWWIPNDGTNSGAEIFSESQEVECPIGVPEYASYFRKEGSVFQIEYNGFRAGWSESQSYLSCD